MFTQHIIKQFHQITFTQEKLKLRTTFPPHLDFLIQNTI